MDMTRRQLGDEQGLKDITTRRMDNTKTFNETSIDCSASGVVATD